MLVGYSGRFEDEVDRSRHPAPLRELVAETPSTLASQRVVPRAAIVLNDPPFGSDQPLAFQSVRCWIERALTQLQHALRPVLDALD